MVTRRNGHVRSNDWLGCNGTSGDTTNPKAPVTTPPARKGFMGLWAVYRTESSAAEGKLVTAGSSRGTAVRPTTREPEKKIL